MNEIHRESLFDDDDADYPATSWGIRMRLARIQRIEEAQKKLDQQFADAQAWFNAKAEQFNWQIEYEREQMRNQLVVTGEKSIPTDLGTVSLRKGVKKHWPEPDVLLAFAKKEAIADAIKTKEVPVMKVIDKFVADTGVIPEGYTSEETLGVTIRPPSAKQAPVQLPEAA